MAEPPRLTLVPGVTPESVASEAEASIVGNLMTGAWPLAPVAAVLRPEHFQSMDCGLIYQAILDCDEVGEQINPLTVAERLERNGHIQAAGGLEQVVLIAMEAVPSRSPESVCGIVLREASRQKLRKLGLRLVETTEQANRMDPGDLAQLVSDYAKTIAKPALAVKDLVLDVESLHQRHTAQAWAVKSVIPANSLGMIFGASGTFKSFVALDYALHRCYGMPWVGRKTSKGVPVYVAAEGGAGLMRRVEAWHKLRGRDWRKCPMRFVIQPLQIVEDAERLRDAISALDCEPSDIIIDTMSQTFTGEENSATDVATYLARLVTHLRDPFGATVLVVHHTGHQATERPRGSSAILANCDFVFGCYRDEKEMLCTVECLKQKDGDRWLPLTFAMNVAELGVDDDGDIITSLVARHSTDIQEIVSAARGGSESRSPLMLLLAAVETGAPEEEVHRRFYDAMPDAEPPAKRQAFYRALKRAIGQGMILRQGDWLELANGAQA